MLKYNEEKMDPEEMEVGEALRKEKNKKKSLFVMAGNEDNMIPYTHA